MSKSKTKIVLNNTGIKELLKSNTIVGYCQEMADEIANRYEGSGQVLTSRKSSRGYAYVSVDETTNELLYAMGRAKKA